MWTYTAPPIAYTCSFKFSLSLISVEAIVVCGSDSLCYVKWPDIAKMV